MEVLGEISNFCRFCLSQDCDTLMPLSSAIENFSFSMQDIQVTTGISILESETGYLVVCSKCCNRIDLAVDFRRSCIKENVKFLQLFGHIIDKLRSSDIAEEQLEDEAYVKDDPLEIEIALPNETTIEITLESHNVSALPAEESQELIEKQATTCQEDYGDGNSSFEYLTAVPTSILTSRSKAMSSKAAATASNSQKSKELVEESLEDTATKPKKRRKSGKNRKQLCGICGALVYNLNDHTRSHTKENLHQCPHCPVQMTCDSNLRTHVRLVHEKVVIKSCEPCGKGFITYNAYRMHMLKQHNVGEQYQCEICLKMFNTTTSRLNHVKRMHIGELKYECQICQKKFKDPKCLKRHGRVHSTDTPYACSLCPKRFKSLFAKKTHEITHSGIQFACTLCTKVYRYKSLLSMHYRKCHPAECSGE